MKGIRFLNNIKKAKENKEAWTKIISYFFLEKEQIVAKNKPKISYK